MFGRFYRGLGGLGGVLGGFGRFYRGLGVSCRNWGGPRGSGELLRGLMGIWDVL